MGGNDGTESEREYLGIEAEESRIDDYWNTLLFAMSEGDPMKIESFNRMKITDFFRFKELWTEKMLKLRNG